VATRKEDTMKFAIFTSHTPDAYQELADISIPNKAEYCKRWGYPLIVYKYTPENVSLGYYNVGFEVLLRIKQLLRSTIGVAEIDWVWQLGIDTMITNFTKPLDEYVDNKYDFIIASDFNFLNAHSYFVRNSAHGLAWVDHLLSLYPEYANTMGREQWAMIAEYKKYPWNEIVKEVPQKLINAYQYDLYDYRYPAAAAHSDHRGDNGEWEPGSLLIHFPDTHLPQRVELAKKYEQLVLK